MTKGRIGMVEAGNTLNLHETVPYGTICIMLRTQVFCMGKAARHTMLW